MKLCIGDDWSAVALFCELHAHHFAHVRKKTTIDYCANLFIWLRNKHTREQAMLG